VPETKAVDLEKLNKNSIQSFSFGAKMKEKNGDYRTGF